MKDRLRLLLEKEGISSARLAALIEVQPSAVSHILSGRNKPGFDFIAKLLHEYPRLNPRWLLLGEGDIYDTGTVPSNRSDDKEISFDLTDVFKNAPDGLSDPIIVSGDTRMNRPVETNPTGIRKIERIVIFYSDKTFSEYFEI